MLCTLLGLLSVTIIASSETYSSGWLPIPRERVFDARNFIRTQNMKSAALQTDELTPAIADEEIKFSDTSTTNPVHIYINEMDNARNVELQVQKENTVSSSTTEFPGHMLFRQAKAINDYRHKVENLVDNNAESDKESEATNTHVDNYLSTSYFVTEDNDHDFTGDQTRMNEGYDYKDEKEPISSPRDSLLKILSNYNIRTSDRLPNYDISLRKNSRHSLSNRYLHMHIPIRIPIGDNSPNQLRVDPLLAVFLSNFGYYIPGFYGLPGNYRNLYGYAAANNIHNNMPFGSYKIYSDTDSFHK